jgi:hypothetical protein
MSTASLAERAIAFAARDAPGNDTSPAADTAEEPGEFVELESTHEYLCNYSVPFLLRTVVAPAIICMQVRRHCSCI